MKLSYNVTGAERKTLVGAISQELNTPTKYLGAPTFAYEVGGYHIDKAGTVTGADNLDLEDALHQLGFDAETREYDEPDTYESGLGGMGAADVPAFEDLELTDESGSLTVEYPLDGFTPETLDNLAKMVTAKEALIKAALGAEKLPIQMTEETVKFPWFTLDDPSQAAYCIQFIWALCKTAKEKRRVTARARGLADNPKYAMRCWLLSLGLIGDEYKNARKLLLVRLDGNSSFKGGSRPTYTAHCYTYPNGSEEDAMDCEIECFTSLAKAKAHVDAFIAETDSVYFAGAHVEDEKGNYVYELLCG